MLCGLGQVASPLCASVSLFTRWTSDCPIGLLWGLRELIVVTCFLSSACTPLFVTIVINNTITTLVGQEPRCYNLASSDLGQMTVSCRASVSPSGHKKRIKLLPGFCIKRWQVNSHRMVRERTLCMWQLYFLLEISCHVYFYFIIADVPI